MGCLLGVDPSGALFYFFLIWYNQKHMNNQETEKIYSRQEREQSPEARENAREMKNPEAKAAAARERAEYISKEVKQSRNQIKNIMVNMQMVIQAIRNLRAQLDLVASGDGAQSVEQDQARVDKLKKQVVRHLDDLERMRDDLIREEIERLRADGEVGVVGDLTSVAVARVDKFIAEIKEME